MFLFWVFFFYVNIKKWETFRLYRTFQQVQCVRGRKYSSNCFKYYLSPIWIDLSFTQVLLKRNAWTWVTLQEKQPYFNPYVPIFLCYLKYKSKTPHIAQWSFLHISLAHPTATLLSSYIYSFLQKFNKIHIHVKLNCPKVCCINDRLHLQWEDYPSLSGKKTLSDEGSPAKPWINRFVDVETFRFSLGLILDSLLLRLLE